MSDDQFDPPGTADKIEWADLNGRLLLIKPKAMLHDVPTKDYGPKDAVEVDLHVLDGPATPTAYPGQVYHDGRVFPMVLIGQLKGGIGSGRFSLGRLEQGPATKGKPPWRLADPTEADKDLARRYLASDKYKQNERSIPAQATPVGPASTQSDPWGGASQPGNQPANVGAPANDPWGSSEPPF